MAAKMGDKENYGNLRNRRILASQLQCSGWPFESGHHHVEHQQIRYWLAREFEIAYSPSLALVS
jgi:hypothetical protein